MSIELKIPDVGESVREVEIGRWLKREGESVAQDENLVELETDKASLELPAPAAGVLGQILKHEGDTVAVGDVIGYLEKQGEATAKVPEAAERQASRKEQKRADDGKPSTKASPKIEPISSDIEIPITPAARRASRARTNGGGSRSQGTKPPPQGRTAARRGAKNQEIHGGTGRTRTGVEKI